MIVTTIYSVFFGTLIYYLAKWCYKIFRQIKMINRFPKPSDGNFLLGNMQYLTKNDVELNKYLRRLAKELYPHYGTRIIHFVAANILSPEDAEIFMSTKKHSSKSFIYSIMKNWLSEGLLISNGDKWMERRKILTQAFHFNILKDFVNVFNEETQRTVDIISNKCSEPIEVTELVTEFALYSICETAMGYKLNVKDEESKKYVQAVHKIGEVLRHRLLRPWLISSDFVYSLTPSYREEMRLVDTLHTFTRKVIDRRTELYKSGALSLDEISDSDNVYIGKKKNKRLAMIDVLLRAQAEENSIDYEGICEEVDTFMFEGHDTTATAISFCLMMIANHPQIQDKIVEEINNVVNDKTKPTYDELRKMDYLERCIKESLRLYPSVFFISRLADEDTVLNSGLVVPEGCLVHIHIFDILRNPKVFPSPEKYDPDRFLPENIQERHPFAYIPFSAGPRNCIGQRYALLEVKAFFIGVLNRFVLTPIDTPETIELAADIILRSKNGIQVKFTPR